MFIVKVTLNGNNVGIGPRAYSNVDAASADAEARNTKAREMGLKTSYAPSAASDPEKSGGISWGKTP